MKGNFLKFKRKLLLARIFKSLLAALSVGAIAGGVCLGLSRLAIVGFEPMLSLPIGAGAFLLTFIIFYLSLRTSDKKLARRLDSDFALHEKVQTALAFEGESGGMIELQREDAEETLKGIRTRRFKVRRVWIYVLALLLGAAVLVSGYLAPNKRDYVPPEVIVPFEISEVQIAGIEELIKFVDSSQMEEPHKTEISDALKVLLEELKAATTEPEMQASLATALTAITEATYDSSSMTEILNAMWNSSDEQVRLLAKALNTSSWSDPDWGDYAEKYSEYRASFDVVGDSDEELSEEDKVLRLKWMLENFALKTGNALVASKIPQTDPLYTSLNKLVSVGALTENGDAVNGFSAIAAEMDGKTYGETMSDVDGILDIMTDELYAVISQQKINTNVGEYTLKKLSALFAVPIPAFERPEFSKNSESSGNIGEDHENDEDGPVGGGVGEGVVFGSDDLVLNPLTGEYVEYGELYAIYNTLMIEKLGDDKYGYTEEQKKAIEKYFALLYGGFKDEEGK